MSFKRRNANRMFDRNDKMHEIEMVQFLNQQFVVQSKRKVKGVMRYDIIGAVGGGMDSIRFVDVPHDTLVRNRTVSDEATFGEISDKFRR